MPHQELLNDLCEQITATQFEKFLSVLLGEMGFTDIEITGRSGDRGIDLKAIWTESEVPGLEVDLKFIIQAKKFSPNTTLNPRIIRELRGSMQNGEWALLMTTARVSSRTMQEALSDASRVISIIDGSRLIDLCEKYNVGVRKNYQIDLSCLEKEEEIVPQEITTLELTPMDLLNRYLGENFERLGSSIIYQSPTRISSARTSQYYNRTDITYWYALTERIKNVQKNTN